jgi:hypothetical protein
MLRVVLVGNFHRIHLQILVFQLPRHQPINPFIAATVLNLWRLERSIVELRVPPVAFQRRKRPGELARIVAHLSETFPQHTRANKHRDTEIRLIDAR